MKRRLTDRWVAVLAATFFLLGTATAFAESHVRIVRLSLVEGPVEIDRNVGDGFERALLNLPVTEGTKLRTGHDGRAEVEFENGNTLRITPDTTIGFEQLSLKDSGTKVSAIQVDRGLAYVNFSGRADDELSVRFGGQNAHPVGAARFRLEVNDKQASLAVFKGDVDVQGKPGETKEIGKGRTLEFDLSGNGSYEIAKNVADSPFDSWDKEQDKYHGRYVAKNSFSPYSYGSSDLNYYGNFVDIPGYGRCWQPYFVGTGWDPFMDGSWAFYPTIGYVWVSPYPWAWMPYRYGSWFVAPGYGWAWRPGNSWAGWNNLPTVSGPTRSPRPLPAPPTTGRSFVTVGRPPAVAPVSWGRTLTVQKDSAGLGIPRGALRSPAKVSAEVRERGAITTNVRPAPQPLSRAATMEGHRSGLPPSSTGSASSGRSSGGVPRSAPMPMPTPRSAPVPSSAPRGGGRR